MCLPVRRSAHAELRCGECVVAVEVGEMAEQPLFQLHRAHAQEAGGEHKQLRMVLSEHLDLIAIRWSRSWSSFSCDEWHVW